jgi:tRNA U38,U39,U40 pseudouridine synthase TruA
VRYDDDFDARFSALTRRHYVYRIICRRAPLVIEKNRALWSPQVRSMPMPCTRPRSGWSADMISPRFRSVQLPGQFAGPFSLDRLDVTMGDTDGLIEIHATARSFLHNQIRSFAGTLAAWWVKASGPPTMSRPRLIARSIARPVARWPLPRACIFALSNIPVLTVETCGS